MTAGLPAWARVTVYVGAGGFGAANLVVSSLSVGLLAYHHLDLGMIRSVALALGLDCGAIVAAVLWVAAPADHELRRWGRSVTLGLVAASMVGNASEVLANTGHVPAPVLVWLALTLAVAAPVVTMLLGHLVLMVRAAAPPARPVSRPGSAPKAPERSRRDAPSVTGPTAVPDPPSGDESPQDRTKRLARERKQAQRARAREAVA